MKIFITIWFTVFYFSHAVAQEMPKMVWERTFGGRGEDVAYDVAETNSGDFVVVGETTNHESNSQDGLFILLNSRGDSKIERIIGGKSNEGIRAVDVLEDGTFAIVGYKDGQGWMARLSAEGDLMWEETMGGGNQKGVLNDVLVGRDGRWTATGTSSLGDNDDAWLLQTDGSGGLVWERKFGAAKPDGARALVATSDGGFAVGGYTNSKGAGKTDMWLIKTDGKGALEWDKAYGTAKWEEIFDMTVTDNDDFVMVGYNSLDKMNFWVLKTNFQGDLSWEKSYGDSDFDEGRAIAPTYAGGFALVGPSRSHRPGARTTEAYFCKIDKNGKEILAKAFFGGKNDDEPKRMIQTVDGGFVIVGATLSEGMGSKDFWVFKLADPTAATEHRPAVLTAQVLSFLDENDDNILDANEQAILTVEVQNEGMIDAHGLTGFFETKNMVEGIVLPDRLNVGLLKAGTSKRVGVTVAGRKNLKAGNQAFVIRFQDANGSQIQPIEGNIKTEPLPQPKVIFGQTSLEAANGRTTKGEPITLSLGLRNVGKKAAVNHEVSFAFPDGVQAETTSALRLPPLQPQASNDALFRFVINESYAFSSMAIRCILKNENGDTIQKIIKINIASNQTPVVAQQTATSIRWYAPDIDFYRERPYKLRTETMHLKLKIESPNQLKSSDFVVVVNGKPHAEGSKFGEGQLHTGGKNRNNLFSFTYEDTVLFAQAGTYALQLQLRTDPDISSEVLQVVYDKEKPNLYVLSVGTKTNLQYTMQDAADFASLYRAQAGKAASLFANVEVQMLLGDDAKAYKIMEAVERIKIKYDTENLTENDVVLLYLSSHGFLLDGDFYLQGEDYQTGFLSKAIRFEHITDILNAIPCKKVVFVDACHSGGAKGVNPNGINEAIRTLNTTQAGITTIVSSDKEELSYEDDIWQNGAFTEGILQGLNGAKADFDRNRVITIQELFTYLKAEVPKMVQEIKKQPQHPLIVNDGLGNLPIFAF